MKTKFNNDTHPSAGTTPLSILTALLAVLLVGTSTAADWRNNRDDDDDRPVSPCKVTALLARQAARAEAASDYYLGLARASTLPGAEERKVAKKQAREDYKESIALAREQYNARLELCQILGETRYHPVINPADFLTPAETAARPNPYFPLKPGTTYRYRGETDEGTETNVVMVTDQTKQILGVTCTVVIDIVYLNGALKEYTWDWYAQDRRSNVWYFGELTLSYANGQIAGIEGSWEAGIDGGKPGYIMKANPQAGDTYRQEFSPGTVEDAGQVLARGESVAVPYGSFTQCLKTAEFTPIEPDSLASRDLKFYAPGVGFVLEISGSGRRQELIAIEMQ